MRDPILKIHIIFPLKDVVHQKCGRTAINHPPFIELLWFTHKKKSVLVQKYLQVLTLQDLLHSILGDQKQLVLVGTVTPGTLCSWGLSSEGFKHQSQSPELQLEIW